LQEDVGGTIKPSRRNESFSGAKSIPRNPLPLPPPPHIDKQAISILLEEKKLCDGKSPEDRMAALRAFRRAKGLYIRCAEKWSREHKCVATVQLHVVQELFELFTWRNLRNILLREIVRTIFSWHSQRMLCLALKDPKQ
jgi:hypothetical protein